MLNPLQVERYILFFFFNDPATTEFYPLSLPDPLPIFGFFPRRYCTANALLTIATSRPFCESRRSKTRPASTGVRITEKNSGLTALNPAEGRRRGSVEDRKSTRLNSSHSQISYAAFCLK